MSRHPSVDAVFRDGDRWSWKNMRMSDGTLRTSFYHYATKEQAMASAKRAWDWYEYPEAVSGEPK